MKEIGMKCGLVVLVDDCDYTLVSQYPWHPISSGRNLYACRNIPALDGIHKQTSQMMHRLIMGLSRNKIRVDHWNHNGLDNQRDNLRICTPTQNSANSTKLPCFSSIYKGVSWYKPKKTGRWYAHIRVEGKLMHLGSFLGEEDAARAYNDAAVRYFGEFAFLNDLQNGAHLVLDRNSA